MANIVSINTVHDGPRKVVVDVQIRGDGSGELLDEILIDGELLNPAADHLRVDEILALGEGVSLTLHFGGPSKVRLAHVPDGGQVYLDWTHEGGFVDPALPSYHGTLTVDSDGLGQGDEASLKITCVKKFL